MRDSHVDWTEALTLIIEDIKAHQASNRYKRSVVSIAAGQTFISSTEGEFAASVFKPFLKELFNLGVPMVCAAGNIDKDGSSDIDSIPQALQDVDTPIINVGAADYDGHRTSKSKFGDKLTIYAPGKDVECQSKEQYVSISRPGTSLGKSVSQYSPYKIHLCQVRQCD